MIVLHSQQNADDSGDVCIIRKDNVKICKPRKMHERSAMIYTDYLLILVRADTAFSGPAKGIKILYLHIYSHD